MAPNQEQKLLCLRALIGLRVGLHYCEDDLPGYPLTHRTPAEDRLERRVTGADRSSLSIAYRADRLLTSR